MWREARYVYVSGLSATRARLLVEVFRIDHTGELHAVLAYQYPPPIRTLFPDDYALLHGDTLAAWDS